MNRLLLLAPRIPTNRLWDSLWARAGEVPSFHIAPARTGNANDLITGSLLGTYNSASPAWAVGPNGVLAVPTANAPVIDYDLTTLACQGARFWQLITNLSLQSRDLTQAAWVKSGITATRDQIGADGVSNTATRLTATSSDGTCLQTITSINATRVSGFYIRRITGTGTVEITQNGGATWTPVSLTSAFARYSIASATITNPQIGFRIRSNGDEIAVDFAQLQSASTLGPPVATTTTAASSTADVWDILSLTAGINNLKTIYFRGRTATSGTQGIASLNDNTANNRLELSTTISYRAAIAVTGGNTASSLAVSGVTNTTFRMAARFATDNYALSVNGGAVLTDTSGARALVDRLFIGRDQAGNYMNGYIEEMAGWTRACTDAQLVALAAS